MLRPEGSRHPTTALREPFCLEALGIKGAGVLPQPQAFFCEEKYRQEFCRLTTFNAYVLAEVCKLETDCPEESMK